MPRIIELCTAEDNVFANRAESDRVKIQKSKMYKISFAAHSGKFKVQPSHQRAYDLFHQGKNYKEIGDIMKIKPAVAKKYKCAAEKKRKEFLKFLEERKGDL